jgi:ribosomal protein S18 acetylase RimI-like enzyme
MQDDVEAVAALFDAYRKFYRQPSDRAGALNFIRERLARDESVIFVACQGPAALGFTQLYPSFTSAGMARIFVLNDLFVAPEARRQGVARALLRHAAEFGKAEGAVRLTLSTAHDNANAQAAYEKEGWIPDTTFRVYSLPIEPR